MSAQYVYVASSWRNPVQADVCAALTEAGIEHYDFKNPPGGTGFSWKEVKTEVESIEHWCQHCGQPISFNSFVGMGFWEPDIDHASYKQTWRHKASGYTGCSIGLHLFAEPGPKPKGSDWEQVDEYLRMVQHPRAIEGYESDLAAMQRADTFVMVLPCGKSAHLELGYAWGAGKRTAILLEDPVEPELMYRGVDLMTANLADLMIWLQA
jgi:hypothetical protein